MDAELAALCTQAVTIAPYASRDVNQKPTYGTPVSWACRIEMGAKEIQDGNGRTIPAQGLVVLVPNDATTIPGVKDEITLPAGYPVRKTPVLKVDPLYDDDTTALYHIEVYF